MKNKIISNLALIFIFIVYFSWIFTTHPNLGPDLSTNFLPITRGVPMPWVWANTLTGDGMGIDTTLTLWTFPSQAIYQLFLNLNIPFWFQMKYLAVLPMIGVSIFGLKLLSNKLNFEWKIASLFYLTNTYILTVVDGGQLNLSIAYSLIPLTLYIFICSITQFKYIFPLTLVLWIIMSFDLRVALILYLISAVYTLINPKLLLRSLLSLIISGLLLVSLNLYWLVPAINGTSSAFEKNYGSSSQVQQFSFSTLRHSIFLQQPHWYENDFGKVTPPNFIYSVIPLLAMLAFLLRRNKNSMFILLVGIVGIFLSKGSQPPLGDLYIKLFELSPLLKGFRDPSKFYMLTAFSYSLLLGSLVINIKNNRNLIIASTFIGVITTILAYPAFSGLMRGTFSPVPDRYLYPKLNAEISSSQDFYRTFWIPTKSPNAYVSVNNPSTEAQWTISKRPFTTNITGNYELFNFLRSPASKQLLGLTSVKYLIYPEPDIRKSSVKSDDIEYYNWFKQWFANQEWLTPRFDLGSGVFELKNFKPRFYSINNIYWIVGGDDTYNYLSTNNIDFTNLGLIHIDSNPNLIQKIGSYVGIQEKIVFNKTSELDLFMLGIEDSKLINLSNNVLRSGDDPSGWWSRGSSDFIDFKAILDEKYGVKINDFDRGMGYIISEGSRQIKIPTTNRFIGNEYDLFARVLFSSASGELVFSSKNHEYKIKTYDKESSFRWVRVGKFSSSDSIEVKSIGDLNIINTVTLLTQEEINNFQAKISKITNSIQKINLTQLSSNLESNSKTVKSEFVNPTKHKIQVENAPSIIVFTDNFNSNWEIQNISKSLELFNLVNGFYVDTPGSYTVEYSQQKKIFPGLIVMYVCLFMIVVIIIYLFRFKKNK